MHALQPPPYESAASHWPAQSGHDRSSPHKPPSSAPLLPRKKATCTFALLKILKIPENLSAPDASLILTPTPSRCTIFCRIHECSPLPHPRRGNPRSHRPARPPACQARCPAARNPPPQPLLS